MPFRRLFGRDARPCGNKGSGGPGDAAVLFVASAGSHLRPNRGLDRRPGVIFDRGGKRLRYCHTYPAILQAELNKALSGGHVAVINRGVGGQDAPEELARLDTDVIALRPQLAIWQVGANGAMRHDEPSVFHRLVRQGVDRLLRAGIDVILVDNQRSPRIQAAVEHIVLEQSLPEVASETGVDLFS